MKLSTRGRYGIHAMYDLAQNAEGGPQSIKAIAERQGIPEAYLEQLIAVLKREKRVNSTRGALGGYEVVDFKCTLLDGSYHEVDSSEMAFHIAGSLAFKEAVQKADCALMEPVMKVEIVVPDEYLGAVVSDINSRRGRITETT